MAHARVDTYGMKATAMASDGGTIRIGCGAFQIFLSREEAARLAVDLLNAVEATPVEAPEAAA